MPTGAYGRTEVCKRSFPQIPTTTSLINSPFDKSCCIQSKKGESGQFGTEALGHRAHVGGPLCLRASLNALTSRCLFPQAGAHIVLFVTFIFIFKVFSPF